MDRREFLRMTATTATATAIAALNDNAIAHTNALANGHGLKPIPLAEDERR